RTRPHFRRTASGSSANAGNDSSDSAARHRIITPPHGLDSRWTPRRRGVCNQESLLARVLLGGPVNGLPGHRVNALLVELPVNGLGAAARDLDRHAPDRTFASIAGERQYDHARIAADDGIFGEMLGVLLPQGIDSD